MVYVDAQSTYQLCDADLSISAPCRGIALHGASSGQPLRVQTGGSITIGATVAVGALYVVSLTAGAIAVYGDLGSGDYVTIIGVGASSTVISLNIFRSGIAKA